MAFFTRRIDWESRYFSLEAKYTHLFTTVCQRIPPKDIHYVSAEKFQEIWANAEVYQRNLRCGPKGPDCVRYSLEVEYQVKCHKT